MTARTTVLVVGDGFVAVGPALRPADRQGRGASWSSTSAASRIEVLSEGEFLQMVGGQVLQPPRCSSRCVGSGCRLPHEAGSGSYGATMLPVPEGGS